MKPRHRTVSDGLTILDRRHFQGRPVRLRALAEARLNAQIAQAIYALRTKAGLTQKQLAALVGTTDSVISRLEDADYAGHSLKMLQRISAALNRRLEIRFVPMRALRKLSA
jgi:ribosome-binding protein aMBF1 (putative translation factor)